jgi:peroxiredoxin
MTDLSRRLVLAAAAVAICAPGLAHAAATLGAPAPAFQVMDADGHTRSLAEFAGKIVVLEWTSSDCPYSGKHYNSGNMQNQQKAAVKDGAVWLTVSS